MEQSNKQPRRVRDPQRDADNIKVLVERGEAEMKAVAEAYIQGWKDRDAFLDPREKMTVSESQLQEALTDIAGNEGSVLEMLPFREVLKIVRNVSKEYGA